MASAVIYPLDCGDSQADQSLITSRRGFGTPWKGKFVCYLVEAAGKKILIDTGPADPEHAAKWHEEVGPKIPQDQPSVSALARLGVRPEEIDAIILTHLHWDHAYHLDKYPNAPIYVSEAELSYALMPLPPHYYSYENWAIGLTPWFVGAMGRVKRLEMRPTNLLEGLTVIPTPGHTPGSTSVIVDTDKGRYVLSGDAVIVRENLVGNPKRHTPYTMIGLYMDYIAAWRSIETIANLVDGDASRVLSGHDPSVFEKERYPS
ncbi:MAG: N-acyl homoserine lactonase family protein [Bacillota bacterium]